MPKYFFDIRDGERDPDNDGIDLPDFRAARREAIKFAGDYASDNPSLLDPTGQMIVKVRDETQRRRLDVRICVSDRGSPRSPQRD